jgi:hypothetical protein
MKVISNNDSTKCNEIFMTYGEVLQTQFNKLKTKDYEDYGVVLVKNCIFQTKSEIGISVRIYCLFVIIYIFVR